MISSMAERMLHESPYFRIGVDDASKIVHIKRTPLQFPDIETMLGNARDRMSTLEPLRGNGYRVLIDTRDGPLRNDPEFEAAMREWRTFLFEQFDRAAIVVRTAVGVLQVQRMGRDPEMEIMKKKVRVFQDDEAAALRYLSET
jgi:hypothetical protein